MAVEHTTTAKSVVSGTHLSSIGTVKTVIGLVKAVDENGIERVLQVGDKVYANETIFTAADGALIVEFQDGTHLDLPRSTHIVLDTDIYSPKASVESQAQDDTARIEKAIAEGRDPTLVTDAAAAGVTVGDEGTSTPLVIDFNNTQGNVNSGFPTAPISVAFPPVPDTQIVTAPTPVTPPATPPTQIISTLLPIQAGGEAQSVFEGGSVVYTVTLDKASSADVIITLSNGAVVNIPAGQLTGTSNAVPVDNTEDPYKDPSVESVHIISITGGGTNEVLGFDAAPISFEVIDTIDTTTVSLTAAPNFTEDGTTLTYTATLGAAVRVGDTPVTITFKDVAGNDQTITITSGLTGSTTAVIAESVFEDVYAEPSANLTAATSVSVSGGNFEQLGTPTVGTVTLTDTTDTVTATLTTSTTTLSENGGDITYTVTLSGGPGAITPTSNLTFTLANGEHVTINAGQPSGSVTKTYTDAQITTQANIGNSITGVTGGTEYEHLVTAGSTLVDVNYGVVITGIGATGGDQTVYENDLAAGSSPNASVLTQSGSFTISALDGVATVQVGTTTLNLIQLNALSSLAPVTVDTPYGSIKLTGYSAGTVSYSYILDTTVDNDSNVLATPTGYIESVAVTVTDADGSSASSSIKINIVDDAPIIENKTNLIYSNSSNDGVGSASGGTGIYDYNIGADSRTSFSSSNSDFSTISLAGSVGLNAFQNVSTTWTSESASSAVFNFAFDYAKDPTNPTVLTHDTGVLTFNKVAGTYTVELASPIDSFSTLVTSSGTAFTGYNLNSSTLDSTQPAVMVTTLAPNFFVQYTGDQASHEGGTLKAGTNSAYVNGESFVAGNTWVSISGTANGVAGDTIGKGEVLDFNFYSTNPTGFVGSAPTAQASSMYLRLDGIGNTEDLVVNLKLYDTVTHLYTTMALVIDNADILKNGSALPSGYTTIAALDSNDGLVIIESNDYNTSSTHYVIVGAQVLTSTESITGTGVDFNGTTGSSGGSSLTEIFDSNTVDNDVVKISDIGVVTQTTSTQDASLQFQFTNIDADGDATATQTLSVTIEASSTFTGTVGADSIQGSVGNDILVGGQGDDILTGGLGADTFKWNSGDGTGTGINDKITDFNIAQHDVLDLASLLTGEHSTAASLINFLSFSHVGSDTVVTIDVNGSTTGTTGQTITLQGVDLTSGGTLSSSAIIQSLLDGGNLKTDI